MHQSGISSFLKIIFLAIQFIINSIFYKQKKLTMSALRKSKKNSEIAIPDFYKENQILQTAAEENSRLRQQINKQSYSDSLVQAKIQDKVTQVKDKAVQLAKILENQKRKNIQLEAIIRSMNYLRNEIRRAQADQNNNNHQNLQTFSRKIKKLQYSLQQLYSKTNNLNSKTKSRKIEVDTFRTQRVIDSNIFDKLEKELKIYEVDYKKLLIEKIKLDKEYTKNLDNYNKIKLQIMSDTSNKNNGTLRVSNLRPETIKKQKQSDEEAFFNNAPEIQQAVKFTQLNLEAIHQKKHSTLTSKRSLAPANHSPGYTNSSNFKKQGSVINKQKNQAYQCKLSKILLCTEAQNYQDLINNLQNIEQITTELYNQSNEINDEIASTKLQYLKILQEIQVKQVKYYPNDSVEDDFSNKERSRQVLKVNVKKIQNEVDKEYENLKCLTKSVEFRKLQELCHVANNSETMDDIQSIFTQLEISLVPLIQEYSQQQQKLQESQDEEPQKSLSTNLRKLKENQHQTNNEGTGRSNIQDLINKVKKMQPSQKIMGREQFKREYEHLRKTGLTNKNNQRNTKKTTTQIKKQRFNSSLY